MSITSSTRIRLSPIATAAVLGPFLCGRPLVYMEARPKGYLSYRHPCDPPTLHRVTVLRPIGLSVYEETVYAGSADQCRSYLRTAIHQRRLS